MGGYRSGYIFVVYIHKGDILMETFFDLIWDNLEVILAILGSFVGGFWGALKVLLSKGRKVAIALREVADVLIVAAEAVEDEKLTPEEKQQIAKEAKEAFAAMKDLLGDVFKVKK